MKLCFFAMFVVLVCFESFVAMIDMQCEEFEAKAYCENVWAGVWPDYKHTYASNCGKEYGLK
jgi:hypothetical protein